MKQKKPLLFWSVLGVGVLVLGGVSFFLFQREEKHPSSEELLIQKPDVIYTCPMHPQVRSDRPGSCPICGMKLVPVSTKKKKTSAHPHTQEKTHASPRGRKDFEVQPVLLQKIGVKLAVVKRKKVRRSLFAPARVALDPELYTVEKEYLEALAQWDRIRNSPLSEIKRATQEMIRSAKLRLKVLGLTEDQIQLLTRRRKHLESLLAAGESMPWIYADIFESDVPYVKKGLSVKMFSPAFGPHVYEGKVVGVDQIVDPKTRTARVRIWLKKMPRSVRAGAFVSVRMQVPLGAFLSVPKDALIDTGKEQFVFVVHEKEGRLEPRRVRVLAEGDFEVALLEGVQEGEKVASHAAFLLDSESQLRSVFEAFGGSGGHAHH